MSRFYLAVDDEVDFEQHLPEARRIWQKLQAENPRMPCLGESRSDIYSNGPKDSEIEAAMIPFTENFSDFIFRLLHIYGDNSCYSLYSFKDSNMIVMEEGSYEEVKIERDGVTFYVKISSAELDGDITYEMRSTEG